MTKHRLLDREHEAPLMLRHPREQTTEVALRGIYEGQLKEECERRQRTSLEDCWVYENNPVQGVDRMYQRIGQRLIDYHIKDDIGYFAELLNEFHQLGFDVGFLASEFQDRGIIDEETGWLGIETTVLGNAGKIVFKPSTYLLNKSPLQDCSPEELIKLYVHYLQGKSDFFAKQYDYGRVFNLDPFSPFYQLQKPKNHV